MNASADARSRGTRSRVARVVVVAGVVTSLLLTGCSLVSDGTESYRPPAGEIVPVADCALPDIVHRLQFGENNSGDNTPSEGSLPSGFTPSRVVVCELAEGAGGSASVDAVSFGGDVAEFAKAMNQRSERPDKNTSYSCAYEVKAPAAIYLVSPAGAVRTQWPTVICGFSDDPLKPLEALVETGRTRVQNIERLVPTRCLQSTGSSFVRTAQPDTTSRAVKPPMLRSMLRSPDRDVMGLTACTYRVTRGLTGDVADTAVTKQTRLSASASTQLMRDVFAAPAAPDCDLDATEIVVLDLYRPNGSGGNALLVETDGCRRLSINGRIGYREAPGEITALLAMR